jgi:hypothetical protein
MKNTKLDRKVIDREFDSSDEVDEPEYLQSKDIIKLSGRKDDCSLGEQGQEEQGQEEQGQEEQGQEEQEEK